MAEKPEYRLETLRKIRERKKEAAERYVAECVGALKTEQDRLRDMEQELERMVAQRLAKSREYLEKTMRGEMTAQDTLTANLYLQRLKEMEESQKHAIEGQKAVVAQKQEDLKGARQDLTVAMQELEAIEKHREKWQKEVKAEIERKEEEAQDEIAQTIFLDHKEE